MGILSNIPQWGWWTITLVGTFLIYLFISKNDENLKNSIHKFIKQFGVWIILVLFFIYGRYNWGFWQPSETLFHFSRVADTMVVVIGLTIALSIQFLGKLRYLSTQAIADNRSGSCAEYQEVGDYVVLNIGSVDADMWPWYTGHETWVVPKRHFNKINGNLNATKAQIVIKTFINKAELLDVPAMCHDFIESSKNYNKENIYYGEFSREELLYAKNKDLKISLKEGQKVSLEEYAKRLEDTNRMLNEARTMVKGRTKSMLGYFSGNAEIVKKVKGQDPKYERRQPEDNY